MKWSTALTALLVTVPAAVIADGAAIIDAINKAASDTEDFTKALSQFTENNPAPIIPVFLNSSKIYVDLLKGTATANESEPLSENEAKALWPPTQHLVDIRLNASNTITSKRPVYDATHTLPIFQAGAAAVKPLSADFNDAVTAKIPTNLQDDYRELIAPLAAALDGNIAALA